MKRLMVLLSMIAVALFATQAFCADRDAISKNVDEIVAGIDGGAEVTSFAYDAYDPYAFIMDTEGTLHVHPTLAGEDLKEHAMPIYEALQAATAEGVWITYEWGGEDKHSYVKKTESGLIVGSGY
ncbi:cache domain-containing protein [Desulfobulbus alkaliphilus]|uniref:cache domain-containing protein n=1 Tax=Desulfobulbus alkaliphilus TaxID=869814 RepID=UPI0019646DE1|nr:cache domain-containing protein [Desulfobulbus alkaliphilus]MBM9537478.1 cache domain-containing protein [Desulfobulbus alkaliphilus]